MKNIEEILQTALPIVTMAMVASGLVTVSVEGAKKFLNISCTGWQARALTVAVAGLWAYLLAIHFGGGQWDDFVTLLVMMILGSGGIYKLINDFLSAKVIPTNEKDNTDKDK